MLLFRIRPFVVVSHPPLGRNDEREPKHEKKPMTSLVGCEELIVSELLALVSKVPKQNLFCRRSVAPPPLARYDDCHNDENRPILVVVVGWRGLRHYDEKLSKWQSSFRKVVVVGFDALEQITLDFYWATR